MRPLLTLFTLALFTGPPAYARSTGELIAEVMDDGARPVEGASITLTSTCTRSQTQLTDAQGQVRFTQLPACRYTLLGTHPRLLDATLSGVQVTADHPARVTLILSEVEVVPAMSLERGTVLTREFLQKVPTGRSYQTATVAAAGVGVGPLGGGNPASVHHGVNRGVLAVRDAQSTFAIDVDTASYALVRQQIERGYPVDPATVRVEEFVNAQHYAYEPPRGRELMNVHLDGAPHPDDAGRHLLRVGIQSREPSGVRKPVHLTFLVDVSGSMGTIDKLPLAQRALHHLVDHLGDEDTVALVTYAGHTSVMLHPTPTTRRHHIHRAIDGLSSGGGTSMGSGMELAYELARQSYLPGCENRVIVLSDGDANIGATTHDAMLDAIAEHAGRGITLTTVGFGGEGYQDHLMEQLADKGDGMNVYIDTFEEAKKVFGRDLTATLETLARDVKVQVDFDPELVRAYRLIGYENRDVADEDFRRDEVDGGELGTGHQVTALYELTLADGVRASSTLGTVRIRAKKPGPDGPAFERSWVLKGSDLASDHASAAPSLRRAAVVAAFAEKLRGSPHVGELSYQTLLARAHEASNGGEEDQELIRLIGMVAARHPSRLVRWDEREW